MAWVYIHICELNCPLLVIEINFGRKRCFSKMSLHENWEWDQMWCPGSSLKLLQSRPLLWLGYPISSFQTLPNGIELKFRKLWSGHSNSCPTNSLPSLQMNRFMWVTSINRNLPLKVSQLGQPRGQYYIIQDLFSEVEYCVEAYKPKTQSRICYGKRLSILSTRIWCCTPGSKKVKLIVRTGILISSLCSNMLWCSYD